MTDFEVLKHALIERKDQLAKQMTNCNETDDKEEKHSDTAIEFRIQLIRILAHGLTQNHQDRELHISKWAEQVADTAIAYDAPMEEALKSVKLYRQFIWEEIQQIVSEKGLAESVILSAMSLLDSLLDQAVYIFSLGYVKKNQETLDRVQTSFLEMTTPIVPIFEGVAVLPLIGELSEDRAKVIMERTLKKAVDLKLEHLFIDLSGVMTMDTMVSHEIIKIVDSLQLLGVRSTLTGIRPEISRTIVNLGIRFKTASRGTLKQAIQEFVSHQKFFKSH